MLGFALGAALLATASPAFVASSHRFAFDLPAGCRAVAASGRTPGFADCGKGYARVAFAPGGTDRPALQRLANSIVGSWTNLKLLENQPGGTLDGAPMRTIVAEGVSGGNAATIEILAAPHDGGWYALVFAAPNDEYVDDGARYFARIRASFRFMPARG